MMAGGHVSDSQGYAGVARSLAEQALSVAVDAAPHRAPEGERRWPMAEALPAARVLVGIHSQADAESLGGIAGALSEALLSPAGKVTDGFGHTRPVYGCLALHLVGTAARLAGHEDASAMIDTATQKLRLATDHDIRTGLCLGTWMRLLKKEHDVGRWPTHGPGPTEPAPLAPLGRDDLIDAWTYNELTELHALHPLAMLTQDPVNASIARAAALYHLGHTQPDYTTYQPWALAAFASDPDTAVFAEQQLHDVATHLNLSGPGGAVLPALLLADAVATLSGRLAEAWL